MIIPTVLPIATGQAESLAAGLSGLFEARREVYAMAREIRFTGKYGGTDQHAGGIKVGDEIKNVTSYEVRFFVSEDVYAHLSRMGILRQLEGNLLLTIHGPSIPDSGPTKAGRNE